MITALPINNEEWKKRHFIRIGGFSIGVFFSPRLYRKRSKVDYREEQKEGEKVVRQQRQLHRVLRTPPHFNHPLPSNMVAVQMKMRSHKQTLLSKESGVQDRKISAKNLSSYT